MVLLVPGATGLTYATIARNLTVHRRLEALQRSIQVLSAPLIQVWDGVLALPVIGLVDSARAAQMMDALLSAIHRSQCRVAILDLTGVEAIDTTTVDHLFKIVGAASLLGCDCVVTGVSAPVAHTVTQLGLDLSTLRTFRALQDGLRYALRGAAAQKRAGG